MAEPRPSNVRLIAIALLAVAILIALVVATGGGFPSPSGSSAPPPAPAPEPPTPAPPAGKIHAQVTATVHHLAGHTWQFLYTVKDTGKLPLGGFQLNAERSNLFHVTGRSGWVYYGAGVCNGQPPSVLIYWSTHDNVIAPGGSAQFGFEDNTAGVTSISYAISWSTADPALGRVPGPRASTLPASGPCH